MRHPHLINNSVGWELVGSKARLVVLYAPLLKLLIIWHVLPTLYRWLLNLKKNTFWVSDILKKKTYNWSETLVFFIQTLRFYNIFAFSALSFLETSLFLPKLKDICFPSGLLQKNEKYYRSSLWWWPYQTWPYSLLCKVIYCLLWKSRPK